MLARVLLNGEASRQKRKREKKNVTEKADCVWILCIIGYGLRELCGCGFVWAYKSNNRECDENVPLTPLTAHTHSERASNSECERANKQNTRRTNAKDIPRPKHSVYRSLSARYRCRYIVATIYFHKVHFSLVLQFH